VQVRAGIMEESREFLLELHIDAALEAEVVIDLRGRGFAESVGDIARAIGLRRERASVHDEQPVLLHWLGFWRQHSRLLLHSPLRVAGVERDYAVVEASEGGVAVTVCYGDGPVGLPEERCREWHVINGAEAGVVVIGLDAWRLAGYEIRDARGRLASEGSGALGRVERFPVPAGGRHTARELSA
jgi:hypothetical protein